MWLWKYHKTHSQIALKWLISQKNVCVVFTSYEKKHIEEDLGVFNFDLEKKDLENISKNYKGQIFKSDCVSLEGYFK